VKLYRQIQQSIVWTDSDQLKLWLLLLLKANHSDSKFLFNGEQISLTSGQLVTGAHVLASEFNQGVKRDNRVTWRTLWRWVKKFENQQMLTIESSSKYSVISITGWGQYQSDDNQVTIAGQSTDNHMTTNKNDKNVKNEKNKDILSGKPDSKEPIDFKKFIQWFNQKTGKRFKDVESNRKIIRTRIKEGYTKQDLALVTEFKVKQWKDDPKMNQYLRITTIFAPGHFANYLNEAQGVNEVNASEQAEQSATDMNDLDRQQEENLRRAEEKYRKEHPELNE
jgi:uncharacterized phage protein (TIGR02220 family)